MSNTKQETHYKTLFKVHYDYMDNCLKSKQFVYQEFLKQYFQSCMEAIKKILIEDNYGYLFKEICNFTNEQLNQKLDQDSTQQTNNFQSGQIEVEQEKQNKQIQKANNSSTFQSENKSNDHYALNQQEIQTQKQISLQAQQEIQYYVYEDLNNLMEVLTDVKQTLIHFKNQMNHQYIPLSLNRLIQQVNLSKMIHFDCTKRYKNKDEEYFYQKEKDNAQQIYYKLLDEMQLPNFKEINICLSNYEQNFGQVNSIKQLPLYETVGEEDFNQKVVLQVFGGIQHVDQKQSQIKKGQYMKLGFDQIKNNIKQREIRAQGLLKQNFHFKK